jgi:hypothetical protein
MCQAGAGGHEVAPLLKNILWTAYKMCVLYALLAMGRVFCHWLFEWLQHLAMETNNPEVWNIASSWLESMNVNVKIRQKPTKGSWSVKGTVLLILMIYVLTSLLLR